TPDLENHIRLIATKLAIIGHKATFLEGRNLSLDQVSDSIREIEEVLDAYRVDDHAKGPLYSKMHEVYTTFQIIMGRNAGYMEIMEQRDDPDFHIYKYAPMNSAECERVFSAINDILSDKRMSFEIQNLKH